MLQNFEFWLRTLKLGLTRSHSFSICLFHGMKWFKLRDEIESIVLGEIIQCKHSNNSLQSHSEWHFSDKPNAIGNPIQIKPLKVSLKIRNLKYTKNILSYKCVESWIWRKQLCRWMNKSHKVINIDRHSFFCGGLFCPPKSYI